jgi:hypothetical protein
MNKSLEVNNTPRLSIIIVSYNTKDVTDNCLASLYSSDWREKFEVIVVDNNSHDGSVEMIKSKYPEVKLIANSDNKLFAIANNQGARIAKGDYLLLLNSDTLVYDDNLQRMIDYYDTLPDDVICIGPKVLNGDKTLQSYGFPNSGYRERIVLCFKLNKIIPEFVMTNIIRLKGVPYSPSHDREVGWVVGACMMIRRDLYAKVGGLNENIIFYGEEPEFGLRTSRMGYRTLYYSGSEIIHLGGVSTTMQQKIRPTELEKRLERYAALINETMGYTKGIRASEIAIFSAKIKRLISSNKDYFTSAINYERKVVEYLQAKRHEEKNPN